MIIYGVSPFIQQKEVDAYCFRACGHILVGAIDGGDHIGGLCPCKTDPCPYEERRTPVLGTVGHGDDECDLIVRKLKPVIEEFP